MAISKTSKYKFEFFFYDRYELEYQSFFKEKRRLTIWSEENDNLAFPAMFDHFEVKNNKVYGTMILLLKKTRNLYDIKSRKYYMNRPDNLVGHLILLDGEEEVLE